MMAKAPRMFEPPRIMAKGPRITPKPPPNNAKSTQQNTVWFSIKEDER